MAAVGSPGAYKLNCAAFPAARDPVGRRLAITNGGMRLWPDINKYRQVDRNNSKNVFIDEFRGRLVR